MVGRIIWTIWLIVGTLVVAGPVSADVMLCTGGSPSTSFSVSDGPIIVAQCTLEAASDGTILVIASTSVNRVDTDYAQIRMRVSLNQPNGPGLVTSDRVHDVYGTTYF